MSAVPWLSREANRAGRALPNPARSSKVSTMAEERLRRSTDIRRVLGSGARAHGAAVVVHGRRRADGGPGRWAVIAGRKVGSAVERNRAKRRLRALLTACALPPGTDLVVVARRGAVDVEHADLERELLRLIDGVTGAGVAR